MGSAARFIRRHTGGKIMPVEKPRLSFPSFLSQLFKGGQAVMAVDFRSSQSRCSRMSRRIPIQRCGAHNANENPRPCGVADAVNSAASGGRYSTG